MRIYDSRVASPYLIRYSQQPLPKNDHQAEFNDTLKQQKTGKESTVIPWISSYIVSFLSAIPKVIQVTIELVEKCLCSDLLKKTEIRSVITLSLRKDDEEEGEGKSFERITCIGMG